MSDDGDLLQELHHALAEAYIQTGTQHLDLTMVIKGKQKLKELQDAQAFIAAQDQE